ncbi:MAG: hypothetical protein LBB34_01445, partial [Holosporales bacterium]|nr:hypothetical protein [Holosporales bacterium]
MAAYRIFQVFLLRLSGLAVLSRFRLVWHSKLRITFRLFTTFLQLRGGGACQQKEKIGGSCEWGGWVPGGR